MMKKNIKTNIILQIFIFLLMTLMLLYPAQYMSLKICLVSLIISFCIAYKWKKIKVYKYVVGWMAIYISFNIFFIFLSLFYGNNISHVLNINIIEPILYFCIIVLIDEKYYRILIKYITVITIIITIYNIIYAFSINGLLPGIVSENMPGVFVDIGGLYLGYKKITTQNISWLLFLIPYFISKTFIEREARRRYLYYFISGLGIINALLCLRTAYIIGLILAAILVFGFAIITRIKLEKRVICFWGIMFAIALISIFCINDFREKVIELFFDVAGAFRNSSTINEFGVVDGGGSIRYEQFKDLINTWKQKPLLGWGEPSNAQNVIRSDVVGNYELTYVAMLMQRGILGMTIYVLQIGWIYVKLIKIIRHKNKYAKEGFCVLVAFSVMLFANATNPYLKSFDRLIIQFWPLILINLDAMYLQNNREIVLRRGETKCQL